MSQAQPVVSVLTTVYNGGPYLAEMIESVLAQTYRPLDFVLVDDGSEDSSAEVAEQYMPALRVVRQPARLGIGVSRNWAISLARGDFLTFPDADDRLLPNAVERMVEAFHERPELAVVHAHLREFVSPDLDPQAQARLLPAPRPMPCPLPAATLIRSAALGQVGGFATDLYNGVSIDWSARLMEARLTTTMLPDVLYERRLHKTNVTLSARDESGAFLRIVKSSLDRRRAAGQRQEVRGEQVGPAET